MRALLAGLFVFAMTLTTFGVIGSRYPGRDWPGWAGPAVISVMR